MNKAKITFNIDKDGIAECPFCRSMEYEIITKNVCGGHGDYGSESYYKCQKCNCLITFENYYDQFDKSKFNRRDILGIKL